MIGSEWSVWKGLKNKWKWWFFKIPPIYPLTCSFNIMSVHEKASPNVRTASVDAIFPVFVAPGCSGHKQLLERLNSMDSFSSIHTKNISSTLKWGAHDKSAFRRLKVAWSWLAHQSTMHCVSLIAPCCFLDARGCWTEQGEQRQRLFCQTSLSWWICRF